MRTVVGLYDRFEDAQSTVRALKDAGFADKDISMVANDRNEDYGRQLGNKQASYQEGNQAEEGAAAGAGTGAVIGGIGGLLLGLGTLAIPGIGPVLAAGPIVATLVGAGAGAAAGGIVGGLIGMGIPEEHANAYAEGVRQGGTLVVVRAEDRMADKATNVMNRFGPVDIERRMNKWQQSDNWSHFDEEAEPLREEMDIPVTGGDRDLNIPVVEEDIEVGKREVKGGGVKVHAYVEEKPVQKDVNLRQENIHVERRPVDRPATGEDQFVEGEAEFTEKHEKPVVNKEARVVEEVHIDKDVSEERQTVSDTVRRQVVDVDNIDDREWREREPRFQQHYRSTYGSSGRGYENYSPAYRYGYAMGRDNRYSNYRDWNQMEPTARQNWDRYGRGTRWDDMSDAVRYGWEESRRR